VHWLYTQQLPDSEDYEEWSNILGEHSDNSDVAKIQAYAFADRFMIPTFRRVVNNNFVDNIGGSQPLEVYNMLPLAKEAFKTLPSNRPILQYLVDLHCKLWTNCCEDDPESVKELPPAFTLRAMRRLKEMLQEEKYTELDKTRCYYEHTDDAEASACGKPHMRYDEEKEYGVFGRTIRCGWCRGNEESSDSD